MKYCKLILVGTILGGLLSACGVSKETAALMEQAKSTFGVIPAKMPGAEKDTPALVELGKKLYFEKRLSANDTQSCNTCHRVDGNRGGVDNAQFSKGAFGKLGGRNAPTVWNAGFHVAQFWDGRAVDLKEQAKGPILNPVEMAMPGAAAVVKKLSGIAEYKPLFAKAFPGVKDALTYDNLAGAIAAFERTLRTEDRLDDFIKGDVKALSTQEQRGLKTFVAAGCVSCHNGPLLGGNSYRKMGQVNPYGNKKDLGRFEATKQESDKYLFKVPSLRNIEKTGPYFHDGGARILPEAVKQMAFLQLGKKLRANEIEDITAFLKALTHKGGSKTVANK